MEQMLLSYCIPKETFTAIIMVYENMMAIVCSSDSDTNLRNIAARVLQ